MFIGDVGGNVQNQEQPVAVIRKLRKVVDSGIEKVLDEEQLKDYQREREEGRVFRRNAHARLLVAAMDERLFLSKAQRLELEKGVSEWLLKQEGELYWMFYLQNANYIPSIPRSLLNKSLTAEQKSALKGFHSYNYSADDVEWQMLQQVPAKGFLIEDD